MMHSSGSLVVAKITSTINVYPVANVHRAVPRWLLGVVLFLSCAMLMQRAPADELIRLRNGIILRGFHLEIATLDQNPFAMGAADAIQTRPIWMVDDGLRRIYIHRLAMVAGAPVTIADLHQKIELWQPVPSGGREVQGLGELLGISSLNDYGRRKVIVRGPDGQPLTIVQGITELTARYAVLEALKATPSYKWSMRLATSSLDSATLLAIFKRRLNMNDLDTRLDVVRFFNECERYGDAKQVLQETIRLFPNEDRLQSQVASITERQASQLLKEAQVRLEAGQPVLASQILQQFPLNDVGRVTRIEVQDALADLNQTQSQVESILTSLRQQVQQLPPAQVDTVSKLLDEMQQGLSVNTLTRMSDYTRLGQADEIPLDSRIALAICGWLLGSGSGEQNLSIAVSLITVREKVREYLTTSNPARREAILNELRDIEGAEPEYISRMLPLLDPVQELPEAAAHETIAGSYRMRGIQGMPSDADYDIQLPPEYDPRRPYPCIVALAPPSADPASQIEWWSGRFDEKMKTRLGLGSRHGYIVIAPNWTRSGQGLYEFTAIEHARVLASLRDAMRRTQIDSDRVFIVGHGEGGTAAWDIALSHPDLWAGMVADGGEPRKTIRHYDDNGKYVPLYFLMGEKDGTPPPFIRCGPTLDDYMGVGYDAMVVMYQGRGREYFYEDMPNIFEWLNSSSHVRQAMPKEINTSAMRNDDRFFWWLEMGPLKPNVAINPLLWDYAERTRAGKVDAAIGAENQVRVGQGPTDSFTVWLSPDMGLDMSKRISVRYRSRPHYVDYQGDLSVMLEDVRTRADRKHPFWAKVMVP